MNSVSYFDHRVICSCMLSVDIATDRRPGRKNIRCPLCPSRKATWRQSVLLVGRTCDGCIARAGAAPRLARRNTPAEARGLWESSERFSLAGPDSAASKPQIPQRRELSI